MWKPKIFHGQYLTGQGYVSVFMKEQWTRRNMAEDLDLYEQRNETEYCISQ
jgi:hypothetical protein